MRPRFTTRTLLVLTALAAAGCYGWIARPTIVAQRFVAAVNRGELESLNNEFHKKGFGFPGDSQVTAETSAWTRETLLSGRRHVEVCLSSNGSRILLLFSATSTGVRFVRAGQ